jgi:hypothetical protein
MDLIDRLIERRRDLLSQGLRPSEQDEKFLLMLLLNDVQVNPQRYI